MLKIDSEQHWHKAHRFTGVEKYAKEPEHNEHMREINLVAVLTDFQ